MSNANLESTLAERKSRYGTFEGHSALAQQLKRTMKAGASWPALADDQKECLEMVMHKVARILNGDPNYIDSWHDISGYVTLVEQRLQGEQPPPTPFVVADGPYCDFCEQLADYWDNDNPRYDYICSNCAAEKQINTNDCSFLGRL